jgi:NADP-dependent 3-hydroxy acid dehydrogenase YdfG
MNVKLKPLDEQVVVITGDSSGIGLATACAAAERGAKVVLTARDEQTLAEVARQIGDSGGQAAYVAADVGRQEELDHVTDAAVERFGGFDTWVTTAAAGLAIAIGAAATAWIMHDDLGSHWPAHRRRRWLPR